MIHKVIVVLLALAAGCSSSDNTTDGAQQGNHDGGTGDLGFVGDGSGAEASWPHAFCQPPPTGTTPPPNLGDPCAAGSNMSLCLMSGTADSCDTGLCLWDANDPADTKAYCTMSCSPTSADACPPSFECKQDSCDEQHVCVRTSLPPETQLKVQVTNDVIDSAYVTFALGSDQKGNTFWVSSSNIYQRAASGAFSTIGTISASRQPTAVANGNDIFFYPDGDVTELVRVRDGDVLVTEVQDYDILGMFKTKDGTIYFLGQRIFGDRSRSLVPITAELEIAPTGHIALSETDLEPYSITSLRSYGFIGSCQKPDESTVLCASEDGVTINSLGDLKIAPRDFRFSFTPDALWGFRADDETKHTTVLVHWDGSEWHEETSLSQQFSTIVAVLPLSADRSDIVAMASDYWGESSEALLLKNGCWQPLHDFAINDIDIAFGFDYSPHSVTQLDDQTIGWLTGNGSTHDLHSFLLSSFSNWN